MGQNSAKTTDINLYEESIRYLFAIYYTNEKTMINNEIFRKVCVVLFNEINTNSSDINFKKFFKDRLVDNDISKEDLEEIMSKSWYAYDKNNSDLFYEYALNMRAKYQYIKEKGIYYVTSLFHNIFENRHHLFEVNHYAFQKNKKQLKSKVINTKEMFNVEFELGVNVIDYFERTSTEYNEKISYFNPFILNEIKFSDGFISLVKKFEKKDKTKNLEYTFIESLNVVQFAVVEIQQQSLLGDIILYEAKDKKDIKKVSVHKFIQQSIIDHNKYANLHDENVIRLMMYLKYFDNYLSNKSLANYKNITIDDLGCKNFDEESKKESQKILDKIMCALSKTSTNTLNNLHKHFSDLLVETLKSYKIKISMEDKYFIRDIVLFMITGELKDIKLDNKTFYNEKFEELYNQYKTSAFKDRMISTDFRV